MSTGSSLHQQDLEAALGSGVSAEDQSQPEDSQASVVSAYSFPPSKRLRTTDTGQGIASNCTVAEFAPADEGEGPENSEPQHYSGDRDNLQKGYKEEAAAAEIQEDFEADERCSEIAEGENQLHEEFQERTEGAEGEIQSDEELEECNEEIQSDEELEECNEGEITDSNLLEQLVYKQFYIADKLPGSVKQKRQ